jgi:signal transduction histidine kinase/integral membrane sensor domain MASE1
MSGGARTFTSIVERFGRAGKGPLATAAAYAIGAQVGFHLRFPPATTSILWPANAILTSAFLLANPKNWWIYLLATFPVHLLVELPVVKPAEMVPLLFATNCSEALIAAAIVRSFSDRPDRFDTLRRMAVFIGGAVLAGPLLSSFLDAALVSDMTGEQYWAIWSTRVPANALTELTLVPPTVILVSSGMQRLRNAARYRIVEAIALTAATFAAAIAVFGDHIYQMWPMSGLPAISLAFPLPLVLLAALRFGPAGASMSLTVITLVLIWTGMNGRGPFATLLPSDGVLALQTFLIIEALPLMCLSAIVEERRKVAADLRHRLKFERLLSHLSREFVRTPGSELSAHFETWLRRCGEFFGAEEVLLLQAAPDRREMSVIESWAHRNEASTAHQEYWHSPALFERVWNGASTLSESVAVAPMGSGDQIFGALAIRHAEPGQLTVDDTHRLRLIAESFANVLARQIGDEERARAELEAQRSRAELAHVSRQRSMGELTASLAHELNQPLTGILGNAQAARRMLGMPSLDMEELKQTLDDIIADDKRAAETILRIRKWLRKDGFENVALDLNTIIVDVATLLRSDAVIRNLSLDLRLSSAPLTILGDPVELRQLILNLLLNAMDAVSNVNPPERVVAVESELTPAGAVHVSVQDSGTGVATDAAERVFEPFFTTKSNGMGMGLSIAKSIVESHHGSIWLSRSARRGARFEFALPLHETPQ